MVRTLAALMLAAALPSGVAVGQSASFPDSPQGKLAAGFFAAVNSGDEGQFVAFQKANFSEAALRRRTEQERIANYRQLRETAGTLKLGEVKSETARQLVVTAAGAKARGLLLTITFSFTEGQNPKIDGLQISG